MFEWIVPAEDAGKKLITFLTERLGDHYSARSLKRILESNQCQMNGRIERFASSIIAKGDHIQLQLKDLPTTHSPLSSAIDTSRILYEDSDLLIYNKPSGITSDEQGILKILRSYSPHVQLIHRLDRDTTGVLLLAKNKNTFDKMVQEFKELNVKKSYIAIVDGILKKDEGEIDNYLGKKHVYAGQTIWGAVNPDRGLHALTDWMKVKEGKQATLIYCFPKTGRTHQIRVHLAGIGHPILGDVQYCKKFLCSYQPSRYLLHSYRTTFDHPQTGKEIEIQAPPPEDFNKAQRMLFGAQII